MKLDLKPLLNPEQYEAAMHHQGPLLILAGAGSGKTRVITHRIAHLHVNLGVPLERILAVTFTNKAAGEMQERVRHLLHGLGAGERGSPTLSTFHALCARFLRMYAEQAGLDPRFSIVDDDDHLALLKRAIVSLEIEATPEVVRGASNAIDDAKNRGLDPDQLEEEAIGARAEEDARIYRAYQLELRRNQSLDFGDLILEAVRLLRSHPAVRRQTQRRWVYLMVDEFQDTNPVQYELLRLLCGEERNLVVVGDDDQAIYRWRGATVRNILDFEADFPEARIVKLERNYRSTQMILDASGAVVAPITQRREKTLWTEQRGGERVQIFTGHNSREEATWVARGIQRAAMRGIDYDQCAVFYRTNAQSRQIEEQFRAQGLPYQIVGGVSFYARSEIKDLLAYLKVALNPANSLDLRRIINVPRRGIGDKSLDRLDALAASLGPDATLYEAIGLIAQATLDDGTFKGKQLEAFRDLYQLLEDLRRDILAGVPPSVIAAAVIDRTGFVAWLEQTEPQSAEDRKQNLWELVAAMQDFEREAEAQGQPATLVDFLERSALVQQNDTVHGDEPEARRLQARPITLMTIHAAKGLEFDAVWVVGVEEGLIPLLRERDRDAPDRMDKLDEERRLLYVAMTRARKQLALTNAKVRRLYGKEQLAWPSSFLGDLPPQTLEVSRESAERDLLWGKPPAQRSGGDFDELSQLPADDDPGVDPNPHRRRPTLQAIQERRTTLHAALQAAAPAPTLRRQARPRAAEEPPAAAALQTDLFALRRPTPAPPPEPEDDTPRVVYDDDDLAAAPPLRRGARQRPEAPEDEDLVGRTASHTREGFGTITAVAGDGDMASVTVFFPSSGRELTIKKRYLKIY